MNDELVNKVASSGIITIDPAELYPKEEIKVFDLKDFLFMEMILKEKDFREALKNHNWEQYRDNYMAVTCSADAIIPVWAYMLIGSYLEGIAKEIMVGSSEEMHKHIFLKNISALPTINYSDQRIVIKGCGDLPIGDFVYLELTKRLKPVVKSIMYGEPCSTVPVYKKK